MKASSSIPRILIYLCLMTLVILVITGCTAIIPSESDAPTTINYEIVSSDLLTAEALNEFDILKQNRGFYQWQSESIHPIFLLGLGLKPTGGHAIEVETIEIVGPNLYIRVKETAPSPEDMVTQALTYPYIMIRLAEDIAFEGVVVENQDGEDFSPLTIDTGAYQEIEGHYVGQIDSGSIEVRVGEGFMVFRNNLMSEVVEGFESDDAVKITYVEASDGQRQLIRIEALE